MEKIFTVTEPELDADDPGAYLQAIISRKGLIAALMLAAIIAALILTQVQPPIYETSTTLLLGRAAPDGIRTLNALNQLVGNDKDLGQIIKEAKLNDSIAGLRRRVRAEIVPGTTLVQITATYGQPLKAKKIADAAAERLVRNIKRFDAADAILKYEKNRLKRIRALQSSLVKELGPAKKEVARLERLGSSNDNAMLLLRLTQRVSSLEDERLGLMEQEADSLTKMNTTAPTKIIARAIRPSSPISPNLKKNVAVAVGAALLTGCGLAIVAAPMRKEASL